MANILILDAHPSRRHFLASTLRKHGHAVMHVAQADEALRLVPYKQQTLEQSIEFIADDELVEVTPKSLRLRKKVLQANRRPRKGPVE